LNANAAANFCVSDAGSRGLLSVTTPDFNSSDQRRVVIVRLSRHAIHFVREMADEFRCCRSDGRQRADVVRVCLMLTSRWICGCPVNRGKQLSVAAKFLTGKDRSHGRVYQERPASLICWRIGFQRRTDSDSCADWRVPDWRMCDDIEANGGGVPCQTPSAERGATLSVRQSAGV
jgi:hypothetical protein